MKKKLLILFPLLLLLAALLALPGQAASSYTLTYQPANSIDSAIKQTVEAGTLLTLMYPDDIKGPTVSGTQNVFAGWQYNSVRYAPGEVFEMPAQNVTFTAQWSTLTQIYVDAANGLDSNNGKSVSKPVKTLNSALNKLRTAANGGTIYNNRIVIIGEYITSGGGQVMKNPCTVTGYNSASSLVVDGTVRFGAPGQIEGITMYDISSRNVLASGNPFRIRNVESPSGYNAIFNLYGAGSSTNYSVRQSASGGDTNPVNTSLVIEGGLIANVYGSGQKVASENVFITLDGGEIGTLYGGGTEAAAVAETVTMFLRSGRIGSLFAGGKAAAVTGKVKITLDSGVKIIGGITEQGESAEVGGVSVTVTGDRVPVSYTAGEGSGSMPGVTAKKGSTVMLEYPTGLKAPDETSVFVGWESGGKTYYPGDTYQLGQTYASFTALWGTPKTAYVTTRTGTDCYTTLTDAFSSGAERVILEKDMTVSGNLTLTRNMMFSGATLTVGGTIKSTARLTFSDMTVKANTINGGTYLAFVNTDGSAGAINASALCLDGLTVGSVTASRVTVISGSVTGAAAADSITVRGGSLAAVSGDMKVDLSAGGILNLNGSYAISEFEGGGRLVLTPSSSLTIASCGGRTELRLTEAASQKKLITAPADIFYGDSFYTKKEGSSYVCRTGYGISLTVDGKTATYYTDAEGKIPFEMDLSESGYAFGGWYTDSAMTVKATIPENGVFTADKTFYAKAEANPTVLLTLDATSGRVAYDGDAVTDVESKLFRAGVELTLTAETVSGHSFVGWVDVKGNRLLSTDHTYTFRLASDLELRAFYVPEGAGVDPIILFVGPDGGILDTKSVKKGNSVSLPAAPALAGFTFTKWQGTTTNIQKSGVVRAVYSMSQTVPDMVVLGTARAWIDSVTTDSKTATFRMLWEGTGEVLDVGMKLESGETVLTASPDSVASTGVYSLTKGTSGGNKWTATPFVTCRDSEGRVVTTYGESVTASIAASATVSRETTEIPLVLPGGSIIKTSMSEAYDSVVDTTTADYTYDKMMDEIAQLKVLYGDILTVETIGTTVLGRAIPAIHIGNPDAEYRTLLKASDHARELINSQIVMKQLEFYAYNLKNGGSVDGVSMEEFFDTHYLSFVPMGNPDGIMMVLRGLDSIADAAKRETYKNQLAPIMQDFLETAERGVDFDNDRMIADYVDSYGIWWGKWAANINGVDLHRDYYNPLNTTMFNKNFQNYVKRAQYQAPGIKDCFGSTGLSQPETQAVKGLVDRVGYNVTINYHSYSPCLQMPTNFLSEAQLAKNEIAINHLQGVTGYSLNVTYSPADHVHAGYGNWFIAEYGDGLSLTIETGYRSVDGMQDNTPLKIEQFDRLWEENKYGPLCVLNLTAAQKAVPTMTEKGK